MHVMWVTLQGAVWRRHGGGPSRQCASKLNLPVIVILGEISLMSLFIMLALDQPQT
jgi:hypothetical protein